MGLRDLFQPRVETKANESLPEHAFEATHRAFAASLLKEFGEGTNYIDENKFREAFALFQLLNAPASIPVYDSSNTSTRAILDQLNAYLSPENWDNIQLRLRQNNQQDMDHIFPLVQKLRELADSSPSLEAGSGSIEVGGRFELAPIGGSAQEQLQNVLRQLEALDIMAKKGKLPEEHKDTPGSVKMQLSICLATIRTLLPSLEKIENGERKTTLQIDGEVTRLRGVLPKLINDFNEDSVEQSLTLAIDQLDYQLSPYARAIGTSS